MLQKALGELLLVKPELVEVSQAVLDSERGQVNGGGQQGGFIEDRDGSAGVGDALEAALRLRMVEVGGQVGWYYFGIGPQHEEAGGGYVAYQLVSNQRGGIAAAFGG